MIGLFVMTENELLQKRSTPEPWDGLVHD